MCIGTRGTVLNNIYIAFSTKRQLLHVASHTFTIETKQLSESYVLQKPLSPILSYARSFVYSAGWRICEVELNREVIKLGIGRYR
jgi:hypothetical protein